MLGGCVMTSVTSHATNPPHLRNKPPLVWLLFSAEGRKKIDLKISWNARKWGNCCGDRDRPAAGGKFWGLRRVFYGETASKLHSERVFLYKISPNIKKFPPAAGIFAVEIRLVMPLKCIFSRLRRAIIMRLCFMRVYRALLHKHKLCFFCPRLWRAQIIMVLFSACLQGASRQAQNCKC